MARPNNTALRKLNPQRFMGLGQAPGVPALQQCLGSKFDAIQVIEYVTWTIDLPVADADVASTFGDTINLFGNTSSVPGVASVDSSFVVNGILQTDMFLCGYGVHVFAEPERWAQIGNGISPNAGGAIVPSPDAITQNDQTNGALGPAVASGATTVTPAAVEWGGPAWRAAWHLANGYRFVWTVNQRINIIDEQLADVSYFGSYAVAQAAGDADVVIAPYVQRLNKRYASFTGAGASSSAFWPVTHRRVGSVTSAAANVGDFHVTRDFDLAAVTSGGLAPTQAGCCSPFRKLPRCCLIERGLPIGMELVANDSVHQANFQSEISASGAPLNGNGTVPELDTPTGSTGFTLTGAQVMLEQTLDTPPVLVSQAIQVGRNTFKGGLLKIAFLLKGYEVMRDWCAFLQSCDANGNLYFSTGGGGTSQYNPNGGYVPPGAMYPVGTIQGGPGQR
jgi:hypothetical protein